MKHLLLPLLFVAATRLSAQAPEPLLIVIEADTASTGDTVCLPLRAYNFTDVVGAQFPITWNVGQLQFVNAQDYGLPSLNNLNFAFHPSTNQVSFAWGDNLGNLNTVPDSTVLFSLCFKVLAPEGTVCPVYVGVAFNPAIPIGIFTFSPTGSEVNLYTPGTIVPGYVYVGGTSATHEPANPALRLFPNPTSGPLTLSNLPAGQWDFQLSDPTGRVTLAGPLTGNSLDLSQQQAGWYLLSLQSETAQLRPLPVVVSH